MHNPLTLFPELQKNEKKNAMKNYGFTLKIGFKKMPNICGLVREGWPCLDFSVLARLCFESGWEGWST